MANNKAFASFDDVLERLRYIRNKKQEYVVCLSLSSTGEIIRRRTVTIGLLDVSITHPREVFAGPLKDRAASVIIAHNHPSGDPRPSKRDIETTQQLIAAAQLLRITIYDHVIVAKDAHFSFRMASLL